ncbi:MAG: tetratricopeptide repeat protein [Rhodospirillales bacterium]
MINVQGPPATDNATDNAADIGALLQRGLSFLQGGRLDQAGDCFSRVLALEPGNVDALYLLGAAQMESGKNLDAVMSLSRIVQTEPNFVPAYRMLGNAHKNLGNWKDAADNFRKAVEFEPDNPDVWNQLGYALRGQGDLAGALEAFGKKAELKYRPGVSTPQDDIYFHYVTRPKLKHDIEQMRYLIDKGLIAKRYEETIGHYTELLENFPENPADPHASEIPERYRAAFAPVYNRHIYYRDTPAFDASPLNPAVDWSAVEADYEKNKPGITYFDDFLTPEALKAIRDHCLESTMWHEFRYPNGYLGAFINEGFFCPLLLQIVDGLAKSLPAIFKDYKLINTWGYKYDSTMSGINMHADEAAVNVNFWVTPDDANLDPETGGLVIWDKEAPRDWDFEKFNADQNAMHNFIRDSKANMVRVPHRQNRAVVFNSDLFHSTDEIHFKEGYENRRINVTLLYGRRDQA